MGAVNTRGRKTVKTRLIKLIIIWLVIIFSTFVICFLWGREVVIYYNTKALTNGGLIMDKDILTPQERIVENWGKILQLKKQINKDINELEPQNPDARNVVYGAKDFLDNLSHILFEFEWVLIELEG